MIDQNPQKIAPPQKPVDDDREVDLDEWDRIVAEKYKVPHSLMRAISSQESGGNVNAVSPTKVRGKYQVTERTAKSYGLDRNDPFQQSVAAAKHLRNLYDSTPGNDDDERWLGASAKYYGGDDAVRNGEVSNSSLDGLSNPARYAESIAKKWGELRKAERGEMPATAQPAAPTTATSQTPKITPVPRAPQQPSTQVRNVFNKTLEQDQRAAAQQAKSALDFRPAGGNVARLEEQSKGVTRRVIASPQDAQRIAAREQYQQLSPTQRLATRVAARLGGASTQQISEVARPMEGSIEQAAQSLPNMAIRGAGELARAVPSLVRNPYMPTLPNQGLKPVMRQISRGADRAADVLVPENPDDQSWITGKIPRAIGSTLPMMAATVGSGGAAGVPVITGMMGGLGQYDRAVEQSGRTLTPGQQASGELLAMGTGALEGLGVGRALQKLGVTQAVKQRAAQILEEAGTEGLQQFFDNVNAAYVSSYDPSRRISNDPNKDFSDRIAPLLQGVGESALLGGIIGTGVAAPSIPGDVRAQREARVGAQQVAREPQRPMNLTPTAVGPTERVKVTPGDFQRANLETQKGFTEPLTEPLTSTPKVAPTAPITPAAEAAPAAAGMPNRADFAPGFLGDVEYQAALADAQRAPKAAKAGARAAVAKPAYDPMAFRGAIDDAKIQAGEAEAAGNWEAARDQYRSAMDTITEMQKEARRNRDAAALSELAREKSATNTNWQVAKRNAERAARQQASAPQVPPAQQVKAPALPTGDQSAIRNPQSAIENAPTRGLSAPLPASAEPAPQSRPEVAAPATPKPARGLQRNFRAGQNDGSMVFESETQRDLYDLGAALRGGGLQGGRNRNYDQEARINPLYESLQQRLGLSRDEVQQLAMDTHQDVREQMKGVKHLEERRLIDNLKPKPQPVEEITQPAAEASRTSTPSPKNQAEMPPDVGESPKISNPDSKFSPSPESQNFKNQNEILTPQTNRITEGAGDELPRQVSRPLEGQPAEVPTRFTEYEGGEVQRYSKPLEGQPVEVPEKAKPAPQYSPEEAALREREALPPVERRRALRDAVPRGQFGKLSEAAYFGAPRNESLAGNAQLRRLLDLPEMPPYRLPDAPINPKTGEPYTNPAWAEAAQDTLNALAALAGKERSSQINFGAGELSGGQQPSLAGKINPQTGKPYVYDIRPAGKPTRGEYGDLVRSIRELARQKREQIDPSLDAALKDTAKSARTAQEGYQGFVVDERLGDIENSLREIYRRGKPSREENKAHQDAFREIAAEYGVSTARADAAFAGIKAQAASRAQRAGEAQPAGANQGEGEGRSRRVVGAVEQRATGADGRSAEGGGRAAVREAKPVEKPVRPVTPAASQAEGAAANLSRQEWGQVKHDPNTGLYWVTTFDDVGATREGYSLGRSQGRGKQKRTVAKTFESKQAAETYLDKLYARELKAGRIPAAPEKMNVPSWVDKEGKTRPALGEVEILPQTAQDKEDGFRRFRPVGENKQFPRGGTIEEAWYQSAKQATGTAPAPTFDTLAQKMAEVSPNAADGALTSIRDLRQAMRAELPTKEAFDQFLLQQAREDKIALHHHDYPSSLTDAERAEMVRDEQSNYYIGAALREPAAKANRPAKSTEQQLAAVDEELAAGAITEKAAATMKERIRAGAKPKFVADAEARLADYKSGRQLGGGQQLLDQAIVSGYKVYRAGMDFAQWSAAVVKDAGEAVKPHLRRAWTRIKAAAETHGPPLLAVRSISAGHLPEFLAKGDDSGISIGVTTPEKIAGLDIYGDVFLIAKPELLNKQATTYMADAMTSSRNVAMGEGSLPDQGHERYRELYWNPEPMLDPDHTWMWLGGSEYQAAKVASRKAKTRLQAKGQKEDLQALTQKQEALSQAVTGMAKLLIPPRNENSLNIQSYWETKKAVLRSLLPLVYQERALKGSEQTVLKAIVRHSLNAKDRRGIQLRPGVTEKEALAATRNILEAADAYREAIRDTPEGYLETKIHRPVTAEDFALAVVPAGTPAKVIEELKARGLEVQTYKSKNELAALVQDSKAELPQSRREWVGYKPDLQEKSSFQEFLRDEGGSASLGLGIEKILDNLRAGRRKIPPKTIPADFNAQAWIRKAAENLAKQTLSDADKAKVADPNTTTAEKAKIYAAAKIDPAQQAAFQTAMGEAFAALSANDYNGFQDAANRLKAISDAPATNWEKASAIRKAAMLSRPVSHLRNLIGNTAFQNLEEVARIPGSIGDAMLSAATGRRTLQGASVEDSARAIYAAATDGVTAAKDAMKGRSNEEIAKALQTKEVNFNNKAVDKAVKFVFRSLGAEDQIFYVGAYDRAIREAAKLQARNEARQGIIKRADLKARQDALLAAPTPQMEVDAALAAETAVFRNDNALSSAIGRVREGASDKANFALDLVLPFDRTPTNVVLRALEYSPLGLARGLYKGLAGVDRVDVARQRAKKAGTPSKADIQAAIDKAFTPAQQRSAAQLLGRGTVGSGLLALGYALAAKGLMTGFYDDEDYKGEAMKRATGAQPLAIQIGGRWYGLNGVGPIGMALGMGATMQQEANKKGGDMFGASAKAAKEQVMEAPLLSSLKDLSKDVERVSKDRANAGKLVGNLASSFVPGVLTDIEPFVSPLEPDPFEREVKDDPKKVKGFRRAVREGAGQVGAKIPGVRRMLPVKKDITGKPVPSRLLAPIDPFSSRPATGPLPRRR